MGINKEVEALLAQVNVLELTRVASSLCSGKACKFHSWQHLGSGATMGCANYYAWIIFDDGVKRLARIHRTMALGDFPLGLVDYLIESEYTTLQFLERHPSVPAPRAHGFDLFPCRGNLV
ncbi:putative aminoglycoside [Rosellinia necatrix]|uniref:Putative aminoglycoside n=1 Tax=Rosellinia necatrix TaxID=77044 RepID=A0A1S8A8Y0_ROSNE|nr:putative aminoglycoside [Rosellinia necatrix]